MTGKNKKANHFRLIIFKYFLFLHSLIVLLTPITNPGRKTNTRDIAPSHAGISGSDKFSFPSLQEFSIFCNEVETLQMPGLTFSDAYIISSALIMSVITFIQEGNIFSSTFSTYLTTNGTLVMGWQRPIQTF